MEVVLVIMGFIIGYLIVETRAKSKLLKRLVKNNEDLQNSLKETTELLKTITRQYKELEKSADSLLAIVKNHPDFKGAFIQKSKHLVN